MKGFRKNWCDTRVIVKLCIAVASVVFAAFSLHAGYPAGVVYDFDFERGDLNGNRVADPGEIADLAHWSADDASSGPVVVKRTNVTGWESQFGVEGSAPSPVSFKTCEVVPPIFGGAVTNLRSCLYLPQESQSDGTVTQFLDRCVWLADGADKIVRNNSMTVFLRFKWMGGNSAAPKQRILFSNGWDAWNTAGRTGFAVCIAEKANLDRADVFVNFHQWQYGLQNIDAGGKYDEYGRLLNAGHGNTLQIYRDRWYDMVLSLDSDGEKTRIDVTVANAGFAKVAADARPAAVAQVVRYSKTVDHQIAFSELEDVSDAGRFGRWMLLGAGPKAVEGGTCWRTEQEYSSVTGFEGYIDRCVIWNRALSFDEAVVVMTGETGDTLKLGNENASGCEFAADGDPDIAPGVFDPLAMPVRRLRRDLTERNPSVSIAVPLRTEEDGVAKILNVRALPSEGLSSPALAVFVNGGKVGEMVLGAAEASLGIPGRFMKRGPDGRVLLEIRRTGNVAGTVSLDSVSLNGSWRAGLDDGSYADFADVTVFSRYFTAGSDTSYLRDSQSGIGETWGAAYYYPGFDILFTVPEAHKSCAWTYRYKVVGWLNMAAADQTLVYYLNGEEIGRDTGFALPQTNSVVLPADRLLAGLNRLSVSNAAVKVGGNGCPPRLFFDWHAVDVKLPPRRFGIVIR